MPAQTKPKMMQHKSININHMPKST